MELGKKSTESPTRSSTAAMQPAKSTSVNFSSRCVSIDRRVARTLKNATNTGPSHESENIGAINKSEEDVLKSPGESTVVGAELETMKCNFHIGIIILILLVQVGMMIGVVIGVVLTALRQE